MDVKKVREMRDPKTMSKMDYRISVYLGSGKEGGTLRRRIDETAARDLRFNKSPMNFMRYAVRWTLDNDPSLDPVAPGVEPGEMAA